MPDRWCSAREMRFWEVEGYPSWITQRVPTKHVQRLIAHYDWRLFIGQPVSAVDAKQANTHKNHTRNVLIEA